jgi:hypothetical protein
MIKMTEGLEAFSLKSGYDLASGAGSGLKLGDLNFNCWTPPLNKGDGASPQLSPTIAPDVSSLLSAADVGSGQTLKQIVDQAPYVRFMTAADCASSGGKPDYILNADGTLSRNSAKTELPKNGELTVQVDSKKGEVEAKKLAADLQKMAILEQIAYLKKSGKPVGYLQDRLAQLEQQESLPQRQETQKSPEPQVNPSGGGDEGGQSSPGGDTASGGRSGNGGGNGGGGDGGGGGGDGGGGGSERTASGGGSEGSINPADIPALVAGDIKMKGNPIECDPQSIQAFLVKMHSPAAHEAGFAQFIYDEGKHREIDPSIALGFFLEESNCGKAGRAVHNHSFGNIKYTGPPADGSYTTDGEYRKYASWTAGAKDWFKLIDNAYIQEHGLQTLSQVIHRYAPNGDASNNETAYRETVLGVRADITRIAANENKENKTTV